jgi:predicted RNase H-like HicB family nuclease/predicted RNA binding protein YcfA (HicA-like mRNA interferase family)
MPTPETNRQKVVSRLRQEGWLEEHGGEHDKFKHPDRKGRIIVPRHRTLSLASRGRSPNRRDGVTNMAKAKTRYAVVIDGEPGAFGLWVPDMPGCTSMGATVDELLQNAQEALRLWAEDALADGEALPAPRGFEEIAKEPDVAEALKQGAALAIVPLLIETGRAVKANLSLDAWLLAAIDDAAAARGLTRSAFLSSAAREKIAAEK